MSYFGLGSTGSSGKKGLMLKVAITFLTLFGVWGFGDYEVPKFFKWITSELDLVKYFFQWLFMFILAYQGLGGQDIIISLVASVSFFIIFEGVKWLERKYWPDEGAIVV